MGEQLPARAAGVRGSRLKAHLQTGSGKALGINREQLHLSGGQIGVEAASGGRHLVR